MPEDSPQPPENAANENTLTESSLPNPSLPNPSHASEPSRTALDTACERLSSAHQQLSALCAEFEALTVAPERNNGDIRKAHEVLRLIGVRTIGLASTYLTELNSYMKAIDK